MAITNTKNLFKLIQSICTRVVILTTLVQLLSCSCLPKTFDGKLHTPIINSPIEETWRVVLKLTDNSTITNSNFPQVLTIISNRPDKGIWHQQSEKICNLLKRPYNMPLVLWEDAVVDKTEIFFKFENVGCWPFCRKVDDKAPEFAIKMQYDPATSSLFPTIEPVNNASRSLDDPRTSFILNLRGNKIVVTFVCQKISTVVPPYP